VDIRTTAVKPGTRSMPLDTTAAACEYRLIITCLSLLSTSLVTL
jgi:hypothetical protein